MNWLDVPLFYDPDGKPIRDVIEWANLKEAGGHHVADDYLGEYRVSTVWIGMDMSIAHMLDPRFPPIIYETMIFALQQDDDLHCWCSRYATREEAAAGHQHVLEALKSGVPPGDLLPDDDDVVPHLRPGDAD